MKTAPAYKRLHRQLKKEILEGVHEEGGLIPSETQLSRTYGINRMTVRKALDALVNEGLIAKKAGKGSVVLRNRSSLGLLSFRGFSEAVGATAHAVRSEFIGTPAVRRWPEPFFYPLSAEQQTNGAVHLERLRFVNDEAVMLENTYVDNRGMEGLVSESFMDGSLFKTLHLRFDVEVINLAQDIRAVAAPPEVARALRIPGGLPLLHIYRKYITSRSNFFIYSSLYCNTENYTIGNTF